MSKTHNYEFLYLCFTCSVCNGIMNIACSEKNFDKRHIQMKSARVYHMQFNAIEASKLF